MFLNVVELADSLGVSESVVENWVRHEGLPCVPDRGRLLFDRAQVVTWAASRGLAAKAGFLTSDPHPATPSSQLVTMLRHGGIHRDVPPSAVPDLFSQIVAAFPGCTPAIRQLLHQRLRQPQAISWAPVGHGLAFPHLRTPVALGREAGALALLFLREPITIPEPAPDQQPINRLLFFVAPSPRAHLELLGQLSAALARSQLRPLILAAGPDDQLWAAFAAVTPRAELHATS